MNEQQMPMAELVKRTKEAYGLTWKEMADQVGRSVRMITKIAREETSGESYRRSFSELYERGQVEHLTPRRRSKDGHLARVRSKTNAEEKSVTPEDTKGKRVLPVKRGRFSHTTTSLPGGSKLHHIELPKTRKSVGRKRGLEAIDRSLLQVTKSQARADKRVKFEFIVEDKEGNRRSFEVGSKSGFHASDVRSDIRTDFGGSVEDWMDYQIRSVYPDSGDFTVVSVDINEHSASRSKDMRKMEDAARTRRTRWKR